LVLLAVLTATGVGLALRVVHVHESLWLDELETTWIVADGWASIPARALQWNCPPAYYYLVWASLKGLGANEVAARLTSLLAGVLLIPVAYVVARRVCQSTAAGLLAAVLVATDGLCIHYAASARVYSWIQLVSVIHF